MRLSKLGARTMAGALVASGPAIAACGNSGPTYDEWAATDGAAGRINLDEVQAAFKSSKSGTEFEKRVNEIFEGDGIILVRVKQEAGGTIIEGWENLNNNFIIDETDDLLFTITEKADKSYDMRGHGANSYYRSGFGAGDFLLTYLVISAMTPHGGYFYYGGYGRPQYWDMARHRSRYRYGSQYPGQVAKNTGYFNRQKSFAGSRYTDAGRSLSGARTSYQSQARSTSSYKGSATGVRSSWGSRGGGGSFGSARGGGFRGGGGAQSIVCVTRVG